ncbi:FCD domain-containing protein [Maritimibacter fusiformis]|uniref:Pyruvate dehydrogenase complex repressor n=1 Tax=Maritimibacter fusiformis TaxID=2603819 RepID=A0A5D0RHW6_9RHOB|nr:FCD domain-containing protein [Maritimibacter fusiformis]TYB80649.1 GntR family transcriptional regulator [Maritimibacter fusiformis]
MPFEKVEPEKLSAAVTRQIELFILRGILRPGERLPPERELAERLAVSRPSLREAIADLRDKGLLSTKRGAGVYVADVLGSAFSPALVRLFASYDEALFDAIAFRRDMEGLAAERAARFGSDTDLAVIDAAFSRMASARPGDEAARDADFHMAIIEAGNNVILLHMMRAMYDLLAAGVFYNRQVIFARNTTRAELLRQHAAMNDALQARDANAARAAIEAHLDFVSGALVDHIRAEANEQVARQRLDHDTGS